jgi:hypothetical protein
MVLDVGILALVFGVAVLTVAVWITHRDMEKVRRDFRTLINEMHADRVLMRQAISSMENAVNACHRLAEAVLTLARKQTPGPGPAE